MIRSASGVGCGQQEARGRRQETANGSRNGREGRRTCAGGCCGLWLVLSLCWIVGVGVFAWGYEQTMASRYQALRACFETRKAEGTDMFSCFLDETPYPALGKTVGEYAAYAFLPPLVTLALGLIGAWLAARVRVRSRV